MLNKVLENRRKYIKTFIQSGFSVYDIAKYFQVSPSAIKMTLKNVGLEERNNSDAGSKYLDSVVKKRDEILMNELENDDRNPEEILAEYGFYQPIQKNQFFTVADDWLKEHSTGPEFDAIFNGMTAHDLAAQKGISTHVMNKKLKELNIDVEEISKIGRKLRKIQSMAQIWELYSYRFTNNEICEYLNLEEFYVRTCCKYAKQYGIQPKDFEMQISKEELSKYFKDGTNQSDIYEITGISVYALSKLQAKYNLKSTGKETCPFDFKREKRRELIYQMYSQDLLTQQEIADRLNLTRRTVISDIKKYKEYHPEAVDKTYLWRQRNMAEDKKAVRIDKKDKILKLLNSGVPMSEISRQLGVSCTTISKYAKEEGLKTQTPAAIERNKRKAKVDELKRTGLNTTQIAQEMNLSEETINYYEKSAEKTRETHIRRAEELKHSWNGMPTTEIMAVMGRSRAAVLYDQHQTSNILRNNEDILAYVANKNGDIIEEATNEPLDKAL